MFLQSQQQAAIAELERFHSRHGQVNIPLYHWSMFALFDCTVLALRVPLGSTYFPLAIFPSFRFSFALVVALTLRSTSSRERGIASVSPKVFTTNAWIQDAVAQMNGVKWGIWLLKFYHYHATGK